MKSRTDQIFGRRGLGCRGELIYDEQRQDQRPLLLVAPNWLGVTDGRDRARPRRSPASAMSCSSPTCSARARARRAPRTRWSFSSPLIEDAPRRAGASGRVRHDDEGSRPRAASATPSGAPRIGYCFGGSNVLDLARAGADVAAVVSVHGVLATPMPAKKGDIKAAILVLHGAADPISPQGASRHVRGRDGCRRRALVCAHVRQCGARLHRSSASNIPPVAKYDEPATRHGYALAHAFIAGCVRGEAVTAMTTETQRDQNRDRRHRADRRAHPAARASADRSLGAEGPGQQDRRGRGSRPSSRICARPRSSASPAITDLSAPLWGRDPAALRAHQRGSPASRSCARPASTGTRSRTSPSTARSRKSATP